MPIAAVRYTANQGAEVDRLLVDVARTLRGAGVRLAGSIQHNTENGGRACQAMMLEDLGTGSRLQICEAMTSPQDTCRIDEAALARAVDLAHLAIARDCDLLVVNKFGKREAFGRGFAPVIAEAHRAGIPILVGVNDWNAEAWDAVWAGKSRVLEPDLRHVIGWFEALRQDVAARAEPAGDAPTATGQDSRDNGRGAGRAR
ncbi:MAG: DUF2478 domain-containing protein [Hyphomicrobiaceae bacterium]|nr:DUF2478 domain-containing protein [Hyphomicrobiaceae bacterium]